MRGTRVRAEAVEGESDACDVSVAALWTAEPSAGAGKNLESFRSTRNHLDCAQNRDGVLSSAQSSCAGSVESRAGSRPTSLPRNRPARSRERRKRTSTSRGVEVPTQDLADALDRHRRRRLRCASGKRSRVPCGSAPTRRRAGGNLVKFPSRRIAAGVTAHREYLPPMALGDGMRSAFEGTRLRDSRLSPSRRRTSPARAASVRS